MTFGERLQWVRNFRKMTQRDLGLAVGFEGQAQVRIAHYESGFRRPKMDMVGKLAAVLKVNPYALEPDEGDTYSYTLHTLFWLETECPLNVVQMRPSDQENNTVKGWDVQYAENADWFVYCPFAICFNANVMNDAISEWAEAQRRWQAGEITHDEYCDWKLNWPKSAEKDWRKKLAEAKARESEKAAGNDNIF